MYLQHNPPLLEGHSIRIFFKKCRLCDFSKLQKRFFQILELCLLGVKVRNMKMDFNTGGTWRQVGQWTLMMKTYDIFLFG